jgi:hypothetical protein
VDEEIRRPVREVKAEDILSIMMGSSERPCRDGKQKEKIRPHIAPPILKRSGMVIVSKSMPITITKTEEKNRAVMQKERSAVYPDLTKIKAKIRAVRSSTKKYLKGSLKSQH